MNELLESTKMKTPIEIALGIDENGMTTARDLYDFLELAQGQFSRWAKTNRKTKTGGGSTLCRTVIIARIIGSQRTLQNTCLWNLIPQKGRSLDSISLP